MHAIRHEKPRLRITAETIVTDWLKRLFPAGTSRVVNWFSRRQALADDRVRAAG